MLLSVAVELVIVPTLRVERVAPGKLGMTTLLPDELELEKLDELDDPDEPVPKLAPLRSPGKVYPSPARALTVKRAAIAIVNFISFCN
jgi:hypothetical protein